MEFSERLLAYGEITKSGFCTTCGSSYVKLKDLDEWVAGNGETECGQPIGLCGNDGDQCSQIVIITTTCGRISRTRLCRGEIWEEDVLDSSFDPLKEVMGY